MFFGLVCMLIGLVIGWHERDRRGPFVPSGWTILTVTFNRGQFVSLTQKGLKLSVTVTTKVPPAACDHAHPPMDSRCVCGKTWAVHMVDHPHPLSPFHRSPGEDPCPCFVPATAEPPLVEAK